MARGWHEPGSLPGRASALDRPRRSDLLGWLVGLPGLEPGTSSLSGFCPQACFCRITPATCANDLPLETAGDRCEPLSSDGVWTKRGPGQRVSGPVGLGSGEPVTCPPKVPSDVSTTADGCLEVVGARGVGAVLGHHGRPSCESGTPVSGGNYTRRRSNRLFLRAQRF
jgi:hypothetical protein